MYATSKTRKEPANDDDPIVYARCSETNATLGETVAGTTLILGEATLLAEVAVSSLMKQPLADVAGKVVTVLTVDYAPGAASEPHVHPGSVVVYVLEGAVVSQLEGGEPIIYTRGQTWYESPKRPHVVSKNARKTEPAKVLAFLLSEEGEPIKAPMP